MSEPSGAAVLVVPAQRDAAARSKMRTQIMCRATGVNYKGLQVGRVYIRKVVVCTDLQYEQIHFSVMKLLFWNVYLPFYVYAEL